MSGMQDNPYASGYLPTTAALAAESERAAFIRRTYAHLAAAVMGFVAVEAVIFSVVPQETLNRLVLGVSSPMVWLLVLGGFMGVGWLARSWASNASASIGMQYMGLGLYVVAEAIIFVPLLYVAKYYTKDPNLIPSAGVITLSTFAGLTAVVFITKADFSFLRMFLIVGGLLALGLIVCAAIFQGLSLGIWFSVAMIALATGYILYDTSNILHHYRTDQHVAAALALFASVAVLFFYVLRLLMSFSRD